MDSRKYRRDRALSEGVIGIPERFMKSKRSIPDFALTLPLLPSESNEPSEVVPVYFECE